MSKVKFKETLQFRNKLVLVLLGVVGVVAIVKGFAFLALPNPQVATALFLFAVALLIGVGIVALIRLKLKVAVTEKQIKYKLSPLHAKKRSITWEEIDEYKVVQTPESDQWMGGNITFDNEKRFSLTGRNGLAIKTKEGEHLFIGFKNVSKLQQTLDRMNLG